MTKKNYRREGRMHNPPHPGAVLKTLYLAPTKTSATAFAGMLGVDRKTVSRIINGRCGITADMALRIGKLLGNTPDMWLGMQIDHDLWRAEQASKAALRAIRPMSFATVAPV